jgi:hypothetical protein
MDPRVNVYQGNLESTTPQATEPSMAADASGRLQSRGTRFANPELLANADTPLHVTPGESGWNLKLEGSDAFVGIYSTKKEAMQSARDIAEKHDLRIVEHRTDGTIV